MLEAVNTLDAPLFLAFILLYGELEVRLVLVPHFLLGQVVLAAHAAWGIAPPVRTLGLPEEFGVLLQKAIEPESRGLSKGGHFDVGILCVGAAFEGQFQVDYDRAVDLFPQRLQLAT